MAQALEVCVLSEPDWDYWRQVGQCRIWYAVMLSMGVEPSEDNRETMRLCAPILFAQYERRKKVVTTHAGAGMLQVDKDHENAGDSPGNWYVTLRDFCIYGRDKKWAELPTMVEQLQLPLSLLTDDPENQKIDPEEDDVSYQNLEKSLGGLLLELRRIHKGNIKNIGRYFQGEQNDFNCLEISNGIELAIQTEAQSFQPVRGQASSTIRRRLKKALSHFPKVKCDSE